MVHGTQDSSFLIRAAPYLWDAWCIASIVGIWPRYIEHQLITTTALNVEIEGLSRDLQGLRLVQFTDLHLHPGVPDSFLKKIVHKIDKLKPDVIVFTGDFLCHAVMNDGERLRRFLCALSAPHGCFATLGNHDYASYLTINDAGEYDTSSRSSTTIVNVFRRFVTKPVVTGSYTKAALAVQPHERLCKLLRQTPFDLLDNATKQINIGKGVLNMCGLGDYFAGRCLPEKAYASYDRQYPGVILSHNPDSLSLLRNYPGQVVLCGHTHGGQVNIPGIRSRMCLMENPQYMQGLFHVDGKVVYVNRGVGSTLTFRWFAKPEIVLMTLKGVENAKDKKTV